MIIALTLPLIAVIFLQQQNGNICHACGVVFLATIFRRYDVKEFKFLKRWK